MTNKPCEYCGTDLPLGVDLHTRRQRSAHFANCEKRPAPSHWCVPEPEPVPLPEPAYWRVRRLDSPDYWIVFLHKPVDALRDPEREVQPLYTGDQLLSYADARVDDALD